MTEIKESALTSVSAPFLEPDRRYRRATVYTIAGLLAFAVVWSDFTTVIEVSAGTGQVVPEHRLQVVQSPDGGTVTAILVKNGARVTAGQVIVRLDPMTARAALDESLAQVAGYEAASVRLGAEIAAVSGNQSGTQDLTARLLPDGPDLVQSISSAAQPLAGEDVMAAASQSPVFPASLKQQHPDLVGRNIDQYRTALEELAKSLSSFDQQVTQRRLEKEETLSRLETTAVALGLAHDELAALERLQHVGAAGKAEVSAAKAKVNDLQGTQQQLRISLPRFDAEIAELADRRAERLSNFRNKAAEELTDTGVKRSAIAASLGALRQRAERTDVKASANGVIKTLSVASEGQVVKPGDNIAEIVPSDGSLLIQARIKPEDIAFLKPGMPALIKLTAYDYSIFGAVPGTLEKIAGDSTSDEHGGFYYLADIRTARTFIERRGEKWPIMAGMVANVDIVTGKRSIFQYITKPIHRMATMALHER